MSTLLALVQILDQSVRRMRHSTFVRTLLELAVVRICQLENLEELADIVAELRSGSTAPVPTGEKLTGDSERPVGEKKKGVASGPRTLDRSSHSAGEAGSQHHEKIEQSSAPAASMASPSGDVLWQQALAELADMTADFARQADRIEFIEPNRLVARFRSGYILHKEYCERPERRVRLEAALTKVAGRPVRLDLELLPGGPHPDTTPVPAPTNRQRMQERQRQPLVRQAIEMFDGEVLRIDEPRKEPQR
jgi:DNA polymerase-3 subunit gamma/tau